jgi:hypothetical protein
MADLKKCMAMNDNLLKKIAPYLRLTDDWKYFAYTTIKPRLKIV